MSEAAIAEGDRLVRDIVARTAAIRLALASVPYIGTPEAGLFVSDPVVERHDALLAALDATDGLDLSWLRLSVGSVAAAEMSTALAEHDRLIGQATDRGRLAKYADALKLIDQADTELTTARGIRNQLVNTVDVSVLDDWIARNADYDVALRKLYDAISKVGKKVTPATRAAVKAEAAARTRLPPDTRGLVVIMAEIGRGGMNGAVIAIEEARAKLADAIDSESPTPSGEPDATPARRRTTRRLRTGFDRYALTAVGVATLAGQTPTRRAMPQRAAAFSPPEDRPPCNSVSSPTSLGMSQATSSSCPSPPSPLSTDRSASSIDVPAGSCSRSWRSAS